MLLGQPGDKVYRDTDDIDTMTSWDIPRNPYREVDNTVMTDGKALNVPIAIIARMRGFHQAQQGITNSFQLQLYTGLGKVRSRLEASRFPGLPKPF